jgi:hypothetical protein
MNSYKTKATTLKGTSYEELVKVSRKKYGEVKSQSRRSPYVKSKYFNGSKVFLNLFWDHIVQKRRGERVKRLVFYGCALELIKETRIPPEVAVKEKLVKVLYYRFNGISRDGLEFIVQVKENKSTGRKDFMSVFPKK